MLLLLSVGVVGVRCGLLLVISVCCNRVLCVGVRVCCGSLLLAVNVCCCCVTLFGV